MTCGTARTRTWTRSTNGTTKKSQYVGRASQSRREDSTRIKRPEQFFKTFPDNHVGNDPYMVLIAEGAWTCSVVKFTGTITGPMPGPDGTTIQSTNKSFEVEFCKIAQWNDRGEVV